MDEKQGLLNEISIKLSKEKRLVQIGKMMYSEHKHWEKLSKLSLDFVVIEIKSK